MGIELGRTCRERKKVGLKTGLRSMTVINKDEGFINDIRALEAYVLAELNVEEVKFDSNSDNVECTAEPNWKLLGKKLGKNMKAVAEEIKNLSQEALTRFDSSGEIALCGHTITAEELVVSRKLKGADNPDLGVNYDSESIIIMDFAYDEELALKALGRNVVSKVQTLRKEAKLQQDDPVDMWAEAKNGKGDLSRVLKEKSDFVNNVLRRPLWSAKLPQGHEVVIQREEHDLGGDTLIITLTVRSAYFNDGAMKKLAGGDAQIEKGLRQYVQTFSPPAFSEATNFEIKLADKVYNLKYKEHFVLGPAEASWLK